MGRLTSLLGAILFVLMVWTGGTANAAERFDCGSATQASAGHSDRDRDGLPSGPEQGSEHPSGCSGHQMAEVANLPSLDIGPPKDVAPFAWKEAGVPARSPDNLLRPPIA